MSTQGKWVIMALHRWTGLLAAVFLLVLALTGLCLNHADKLNLHEMRVKSSFILNRYNMLSAADVQSIRISDNRTVSVIDNGLYHNSNYVAESGELLGVIEADPFLAVAAANGLILISDQGELIEMLTMDQLPMDELRLVGRAASGRAVLVSGNGNWIADHDWMEFQPFNGEFTVLPLNWTDPDKTALQAILLHHQGQGPTVYRVLLDLHSGRLFGWGGRTLMDLTALAIILLVTSGISGWMSKSRRPRISYN